MGACALAPRVAICTAVVGETPSLVGQHSGATARDVGDRGQQEVDASRDASGAWVELPVVQVEPRRVRGDQGRGAGRVDRHARALEVEAVVHAVRRDRICRTRRGEASCDVLGHDEPLVLVDADEHSDLFRLALQRLLGVASALQGDVGYFQNLALCRVHAASLGWGDVKKAAVEELDAVRETAMLGVGLPGAGVRILFVIQVQLPPGHGKLDEGVNARLRQGAPHFPWLVDAGRITRGQRNDANLAILLRHGRLAIAASQIGEVTLEPRHAEGPRRVEVPTEKSQRFRFRVPCESVALRGKQRERAGLDRNGDFTIVAIFGLWRQCQRRRAGTYVRERHELGAVHHPQELHGLGAVARSRLERLLVPIEGQYE
mmetsp:Transcript_106274/g.298943  ORF Transcript_106274/g.298943 Transcript_106274/m.298943 type:complete len:374 (+) Transcript_106274:1149-2270(+)